VNYFSAAEKKTLKSAREPQIVHRRAKFDSADGTRASSPCGVRPGQPEDHRNLQGQIGELGRNRSAFLWLRVPSRGRSALCAAPRGASRFKQDDGHGSPEPTILGGVWQEEPAGGPISCPPQEFKQ